MVRKKFSSKLNWEEGGKGEGGREGKKGRVRVWFDLSISKDSLFLH